jgi:hypothetical protein
MVKATRKQRGKGDGRRAPFQTVKFFGRVHPGDVERFRAFRDRMMEREGRRVADAEVFKLAMDALEARRKP